MDNLFINQDLHFSTATRLTISPPFIVNYFIHLACTDKEIGIFGSGNQTRNVMHLDDATEILWCAAQEPHLIGDTYFVTSPEHLTARKIAEMIVKIFQGGKVIQVEWSEDRRRMEIDHVRFSSARLEAITGWRARYDFLSGLKRTRKVLDLKPDNGYQR